MTSVLLGWMRRGAQVPAAAILAAGLVLGATVGGLVSAVQPVAYRATAAVLVPATTTTGRSNGNELAVGEQPPAPAPAGWKQDALVSYADLVTTPLVLDPVIRGLGLRTTAGALARRVHVDRPSAEPILDIAVDDARAAEAARIADAIAASEVHQVARLASSTESARPRLSVVGSAARTVYQVLPDLLLNIPAGGLAGLLVAEALVVLVDTGGPGRTWRRLLRPSPHDPPSLDHAPSMLG